MGLIDDKKNVFTTIGAYTSLAEENDLSDLTNIFTSINNKQDIVPFLLDVLKVVVGTTALEQLTGELFTNFADSVEPTLKEAVKKQLIQYNAGSPVSATTFYTNGIAIDAKDIDLFGKLRSTPNSDVGSLLYDSTKPNFDLSAYDAIVAEGTPVDYNNLEITYDSLLDQLVFKPTGDTETIGEWFGTYVDNTTFLEKKEFSTNILNGIYGSVTSNENKTTETVLQELEVDKLIEQVIGGDESFEISDEDLAELIGRAKEMVAGVVTYDMGCGLVNAELALSALTDTIGVLSGTTDPFVAGNTINNTVTTSFDDPVNEETGEENAETIRNGFFARLIAILRLELSKLLTTSPQARMLLALSSSFENNGIPQIGNPKDDLKRFKVYINCVIKDALALLNEFIFNLIIGFLIALIDPVIRKVIKEKINQYIGVIKSLISSNI